MTNFEIFISALSRLPLNYLLSCSAEVERSYYTTLNLNTTTKSQIEKVIEPLKKSAKLNGTSRIELVDYVMDAFCEWRQSATDFNKFQEKRKILQKQISEFIQNIDLLLKTTNYELYRLKINPIIPSMSKKPYNILGLKSAWPSIKSRGRTVVTNFLNEISPICASGYSINSANIEIESVQSKVESSVEAMLAHHELCYSSLLGARKDNTEQVPGLPKENKKRSEETPLTEFGEELKKPSSPIPPLMSLKPLDNTKIGMFSTDTGTEEDACKSRIVDMSHW